MEQGIDDELFFVSLVAAVLAKFLFADEKAGDTLGQKGVLAYLFRGTGDTDHSQKPVFVIKGHVDALTGACETVSFCHFDGCSGYGGLPADLVKSSDPCSIGASNDDAGRIDEVDVLAADIFDGVDDLLRQIVGDVGYHMGPPGGYFFQGIKNVIKKDFWVWCCFRSSGNMREGEALGVAKAVSPSRALPLLATPLFCVVGM